jgi:mRNA interferase RelE/StbE
MQELATNPRPFGYKKLKGREGFRLRVGDYRLVYLIDDDQRTVTIVGIGDRKDIYR